ncbi:serine hydrolase domain-containing protein [Dictyobacter vulcani]|uniref:serine hydrolase domain-containing protein n=1 Tax=Dictyobacter vulcani TaxID=2607529 RepID=UPI001386AA77|nr:serine hydrolase domain-containing protein [Dictyobacter vulcani]
MKTLTTVLGRIEQHVQRVMQLGGIGGLAYALTDKDQLLAVGTAGYADIIAQQPVTPETFFPILSITKSFTALAVMQLYERGMIDIHAPITDYLPWCEAKQSGSRAITAYHLLSHTANIVTGPGWTLGSLYAAWYLRETNVAGEPGGPVWHYSDTGYEILGALLETIYHTPFAQIIQEQIFTPLGMTSSFPAVTYETRKTAALGYQSFYDDRPHQRSYPLVPASWFEYESPAGSIVSTAADMAAYIRLYLNRGHGLIKEQTFEQMIQPITQGMFGHYGLGLSTSSRGGHTIVGHGGGGMGFNTTIQGDLETGLGLVVLISGTTWPASISTYISQLLRAASAGEDLPVVPSVNYEETPEASTYAGIFTHVGDTKRSLLFTAEEEHLILHYHGEKLVLQKEEWGDRFLIPHPDFSLFMGEFAYVDDQATEFFHGGDWYVTAAYQGPRTFDVPKEWHAYVGHYCYHEVWSGHLRIILRKGKLYLVSPEGLEDELQPQEDGSFKTDQEHLRFTDVLAGKALRLDMSGSQYTRRRNP